MGMKARREPRPKSTTSSCLTCGCRENRGRRYCTICVLADSIARCSSSPRRMPSTRKSKHCAPARRPRARLSPVLKVSDLTLNLDTREVTRGGQGIELTPKEYTVLEYLMRHAGRVMSRTLITEYAWGYHFDPGTNIVDVVINHLRKKVDAKHDRKLITTVRGVGYVVKG